MENETVDTKRAEKWLRSVLEMDGYTSTATPKEREDLLLSECSRLASRVEELEKLLREMVKKHGVHSGECFSCDYFVREAGRHNAACLIPIAEDLLAGAHAEEKP